MIPLVVLCATTVSGLCSGCHNSGELGVMLIDVRITEAIPLSSTFVAQVSGVHELRLDFPLDIPDYHARQVVAEAFSRAPSAPLPVQFDYRWQIREGSIEVASGSAWGPYAGVVLGGGTGLGGINPTTQGIVLGRVRLETGRTYDFSFVPGGQVDSFLKTTAPSVRLERLRGVS